MTTMTTSYEASTVGPRTSMLRRMLAGAAVFDAVGGVFCLAAADELARWLSIPRGAAYVTGAVFLIAAAAGGLSLRRESLKVTWIVATNELFALWCVLMLAIDSPNALGVALLLVAALSSAGTGVAELLLARRR
ncbi:MAG: hypothetical protein ACJ735_07295 [Actinomycetes bacterium]